MKLRKAREYSELIGSAALLVMDRNGAAAAWGDLTKPFRCKTPYARAS